MHDFREDLYYRLSVLPLAIPPLSDRADDILTIFYALAHRMNSNMQLSAEATETLLHYPWRGNVRELRNIVEFLVSKGKKYIETEDLPPLKYKKKTFHEEEVIGENSTIIDKFILHEGRDIDLYFSVLRELNRSFGKGERYGRQTLLDKVNERGGFYTEGEIRKALAKLSSYGFIRSAKGRGGSVINYEGIRLLSVMEKLRLRGILG